MHEIDKKKLAQEIVAYRFPEGGGEYIKSQIARHQLIFEKDHPENTQDLLEFNEEIFTNDNFDAVIGKNDNGEPIYMARYSNSNIITKEEIEEMYKIKEPVELFILHHTDLDGSTAAAIAGRAFKDLPGHFDKEVVYFHYNYSTSTKNNFFKRLAHFNNKSVKTIVIIVDLGLSETDLNSIFSMTDRVIFIDHHRNSFESFMKCNVPDDTKVTCLIDTRYSAAYLSYILFSDLIKELTGLEIRENFPAMVSVMDNAQTKIIQSKYISVKITKENINSLKGVEYTTGGFQKSTSILNNPVKFLGQYIFIKNPSIDEKDEFPILGLCGMDINNYFIEADDLYPFVYGFYDKMLTNPSAIFDVIKIGSQLKELDIERMSLLGYADSAYSSSFMGQTIYGISAHSFSVFSGLDKARIAQVLVKYETNTMLSACVKSYNSVLRNVPLAEIIEEFFPYTTKIQKKFGHKNIAVAVSSLKRVDHMFDALINKTLSEEISSKYPEVYEIFDKLHFSTPKDGYRSNDNFKKFFLIISTIVFLIYQKKIQSQFKSIKQH